MLKSIAAATLVAIIGLHASVTFAQTAEESSFLNGWTPMIGVSLASQHFGAKQDFNETNPGILIGLARQSKFLSAEFGIEGGVFQNSFDDTSVIVGGWYEWPIIGEPQGSFGQLRLGFGFGYAEYPELVDRADAIRALTIGDFVPYLTPQASWRITDRFEVRSKFGPIIDGDADFVVGFQVFYRVPFN